MSLTSGSRDLYVLVWQLFVKTCSLWSDCCSSVMYLKFGVFDPTTFHLENWRNSLAFCSNLCLGRQSIRALRILGLLFRYFQGNSLQSCQYYQYQTTRQVAFTNSSLLVGGETVTTWKAISKNIIGVLKVVQLWRIFFNAWSPSQYSLCQ